MCGLRPAWLLRLGLFLYDHIGGRNLLPRPAPVDLTRDKAGKPLAPNRFVKEFQYSDCFVEDARLVILTARDVRIAAPKPNRFARGRDQAG